MIGDVTGSLACPRCRGAITAHAGHMNCASCDATYLRRDGYIDLVSGPELGSSLEQVRRTDPMTSGLGQLRMRDPVSVERYEQVGRPAHLRVMGANWRGFVSEPDENAYLRDHVDAVDGPVLDLACGAGRWTRAIQAVVGPCPVIGIDLSIAMLSRARTQAPGVTLIRGDARSLPLRDAGVGAVVCWNALQLLPQPQTVIGEIARCVRPDGTFTAMTFRQASQPAYRYFQRRFEDAKKVTSFVPSTLSDWLRTAGFELEHAWTPGTFLFLSARRR